MRTELHQISGALLPREQGSEPLLGLIPIVMAAPEPNVVDGRRPALAPLDLFQQHR